MSSWVWAPFVSGALPPGEYQWVVSGGLLFNGSAPVKRGRIHVSDGGLTLGGNFSYISDILPQQHIYVMTGGLEFGGAFEIVGRVWADWQVPETEWVDAVGFE